MSDLITPKELHEKLSSDQLPVIIDVRGVEAYRKVVGIVTDRDITTRVVAKGKDPQKMTAKDVMSMPVVTVKRGDKIKDVARMMEKNQIRRIPVVDNNGEICGMVSQGIWPVMQATRRLRIWCNAFPNRARKLLRCSDL